MSTLGDRFLDDYFAECDEHLTAVRQGLLSLEASVGRTRPDARVTEELFRSYHSLKGLAGMVEDRAAELFAHEMESYLRAIRDGDVRLTTHGVEVLIEGTGWLERLVAARREGTDAPDGAAALSTLRALVAHPPEGVPAHAGADAPDAVAAPSWECLFNPSPALIARGISVDVVRSRLRQNGEIISASPLVTPEGAIAFRFLFAGALDEATVEAWRVDGMSCTRYVEDAIASGPGEAEAGATPSILPPTMLSPGHFVRVDLARLDELMRMIGDMVILRARLGDSLAQVEPYVPSAQWRAVQENASGMERQLRELREGVMRVRLVPVGEIFRRMPFVVRDLARETGRRVHVALTGQDTEIDKFLVERMMDPVLHLVRNAVSHGLEGAEERIAAGKPPEGTVALSAAAAGETVTIEIADDGRGVDAPKVLARARASGLAVPAAAQVDDAALLDLIASPGFSTREETDRVSGRGFGMAVVRTTVQELGGTMRMISAPGRGTRFVIELPLTLAITDALIARIGPQTFAVPQAAVREVIEIEASSIRALEGGEVAPYRGAAVPVLRLAAVLGIRAAIPARSHAFIVGVGAGVVGLLADRIVGQREIVVRSSADPLIRVDGIAGATDLGDGRPVLILDVAAVARRAREQAGRLPLKPLRESA